MKKRGKKTNFLKENWILLLIILFICLIFIYSYYSKGIMYSVGKSDVNTIIDYVNSFGFLSYLIFVLLIILECVLAPIPPLILYVAGGSLFGAFFGGILILIGNLLGALVAFFIARKLGRKFVERKVDKRLREKFDNFSEKYGGFSLFLLRVNPFTTSDLFSYLAGLTNMKIRSFLLGTGLGLIPMIFFHTYLGEVFVNTHPVLYSIFIWISIVYLLVFVFLILKTSFSKRKKEN